MPYAIAKLSSTVLAESTSPLTINGDVYFPPESINWSALSSSRPNHSIKKRSEYTISVGDKVLKDAAWSPPIDGGKRFESVRGWIAFEGVAPVMIKYKKNFVFADRKTDPSVPAPSTDNVPLPSYTHIPPTSSYHHHHHNHNTSPDLHALPQLSPSSPPTSPPTSPASGPSTPTDAPMPSHLAHLWDLHTTGLYELRDHANLAPLPPSPPKRPLVPLKLGSIGAGRSAMRAFTRRGSGLESVPEVEAGEGYF